VIALRSQAWMDHASRTGRLLHGMTLDTHITGEAMAPCFTCAFCAGSFIGNNAFLMRIMTGCAGYFTIISQR